MCVAGDGDFLMNGQEFATAVQYDLPIIVLIMDNGMYGTIRAHQEREFPGRIIATALRNPDFAVYARAFGGFGATVEKTEQFAEAFNAAKASTPPPPANPRSHLKGDRKRSARAPRSTRSGEIDGGAASNACATMTWLTFTSDRIASRPPKTSSAVRGRHNAWPGGRCAAARQASTRCRSRRYRNARVAPAPCTATSRPNRLGARWHGGVGTRDRRDAARAEAAPGPYPRRRRHQTSRPRDRKPQWRSALIASRT